RRLRDSSNARWRSGKKRSVRTTSTWARLSTIWPSCIGGKASTARRRGCASARWRSAKQRSVRTTLTWPGPSTTWRSSMKVAVKAGARLPIRGRQPRPSLPIELPNRRVLHGRRRSAEDRSLAIKCDSAAPDGFMVHSFAGDDPIVCRDHVRRKLGLPEFKPKEKKKSDKRNGARKPAWSPIIDQYVYRQAAGTPYLQVCRTAAKGFFQ